MTTKKKIPIYCNKEKDCTITIARNYVFRTLDVLCEHMPTKINYDNIIMLTSIYYLY